MEERPNTAKIRERVDRVLANPKLRVPSNLLDKDAVDGMTPEFTHKYLKYLYLLSSAEFYQDSATASGVGH